MQGSRRHWSILKCALIGLLLTPVTHAAGVGFYAGIQLGYGKNNQQLFTAANVPADVNRVITNQTENTLLLSQPDPFDPSLTVVAKPIASLSATGQPFVNSITTASKNNLFLGRLFFGYQFKTWLGVEMGFTPFSNTNNRYEALSYSSPNRIFGSVSSVNSLPTRGTIAANYNSIYRRDVTSQKAVDLSFKLSLPFYDVFDLFVKFGGAFIHSNIDTNIEIGNLYNLSMVTLVRAYPNITTNSVFSTKRSTSQNTFAPVFGFGAEYFFTPSISGIASWNSIFINLKNSSDIQSKVNTNLNYFAIGLTYHMVDRYCGQFLCDD